MILKVIKDVLNIKDIVDLFHPEIEQFKAIRMRVCKPLTPAVGGLDILIRRTNYPYLPLLMRSSASTLCLSGMTLSALERKLMNVTVGLRA